MFLLFEETGKVLAGRILSQAESSTQVELDSGKRLKVKSTHALLSFEKPSPTEFLAAAQTLSQSIELELAWEFAPEEEFGFSDLARDYFSTNATPQEQAGMVLRLLDAPHYFRRAGKGRFRKASAQVVALALAAIEKKRQAALQISQWAEELAAGRCPQAIQAQLYKILFKPDKNAMEYKAVLEATRATQTAPLELLQRAGAIRSPYQFHWRRFLIEHFPKGTQFAQIEVPDIGENLPLANVQAFSIDDSATTEIDDALSLQGLGSGTITLGIHIAAPGLALTPGSPIDTLGRTRLSTVYMPGYKITMLPDAVVQSYTLQAGRDCPAVSLYLTIDEATLTIQSNETRLERVPIAHNLRHDQLDAIITPDWLQGDATQETPEPLRALHKDLSFLYRLACTLKSRRERIRGKPETFSRPDYNFRLMRNADDNDTDEPKGDEQVHIGTRARGAPLDLIVAEAMILANSTWGHWMAELGVPAIYRSQASLSPGIKVRMGTKALPHAGIGVSSYAWSTSPLRRYTDLVNQWQIIACARHGKTAVLAAPFKPKDAELFSIISHFEAAYSAYNSHQSTMERFWTLQYVQQQGIAELSASVIKDNIVRADTLPLVLPVQGAQSLARGTRVKVKLGEINFITLDISGTVLHRLDAATKDNPAGTEQSTEEEEDEEVVGPLSIALDTEDSTTSSTNSTSDNSVL